ncbi:MAG: DeoR/GlpR family DNA-binding transcription regulator [Leadbetterella sp.]
MLKQERQNRILDYLAKAKKLNYTDLSQYLDVSYDSIRRDVIELQDKGLLKKVHGGVVSNSYLKMITGQSNEVLKSRDLETIIEKSLTLLKNNQTLLLDGGTTNFFFAEQIPKDLNLTIVTNSLPLAMALNDHDNIHIILLSGSYFKRYQITLGIETMRQIKGFHVDMYFMGFNGIDAEKGVTLRYYEESQLKKQMIESADRVICGVISEKIGLVESYQICDYHKLDTIITNLDKHDPLVEAFTGIEHL